MFLELSIPYSASSATQHAKFSTTSSLSLWSLKKEKKKKIHIRLF